MSSCVLVSVLGVMLVIVVNVCYVLVVVVM